jgi:hypothetical protein
MGSIVRKILAISLATAYAAIVMLGQGLHLLAPDCCHHDGFNAVHCSAQCHDYVCAHNCHDHEAAAFADNPFRGPAGPVVAASDCASDSHFCEICAFLFQAVTELPQLAAAPISLELVANVPCHKQGLYSSAVLGLHTARGPPQQVG